MMDDPRLLRILTDNATKKEKRLFYAELEEDAEKEHEFLQLKSLWDLYQLDNISVSPDRKNELFERFWAQKDRRNNAGIRRFIRYAAATAAIFAAAIAMVMYFRSTDHPAGAFAREFHTEGGSISSIWLDDSSRICLNANSVLKVLESREGATIVSLRGEAYFDIKHDPDRQFIVDIGPIRVKDLGTRFNISAYPGEKYFRTTLIEGAISIEDSAGAGIRELSVNQTFRLNTTDLSYLVEQVDSTVVTGWTKNKFVFIDKSLSDICAEFEKWYGVTIHIDSEKLKGEKYTCVIRRTTTVRQLLEMFKLTTGINYRFKKEDDEEIILTAEN